MKICVTGPRKVTIYQQKSLTQIVEEHFKSPDVVLNVGDAHGVDYIVYNIALAKDIKTNKFIVQDKTSKFSYAKRSMRMVDATLGGTLLAFPNKECPPKVTPANAFCGSGSGTWGTIAYAKHKGLAIKVHPLVQISLPSWLN